jgi:hypothetical protein
MSGKPLQYLLTIILFLSALALTGAASRAPSTAPWSSPDFTTPCEIIDDSVTGIIEGLEVKTHSYTLEAGTYTAAAWSSWEIVSLQLTVRNSLDQVIGREDSLSNMPVVEFTLDAPEEITLELSAGEVRMPGVDAGYSLLIAKSTDCIESPDYPAKDLLDQWTQVVADENYIMEYWEAVDISGSDMYELEISLSPGAYAVVAETTNFQDDIDMYIRRGEDTILTQNELPDNSPVCHFELDNTTTITIQVDPWHYAIDETTGMILIVAREENE